MKNSLKDVPPVAMGNSIHSLIKKFFQINDKLSYYNSSPYDNRWSKTMIGYGPESNHFVVELTYNYGVTSYDLGKFLMRFLFNNMYIRSLIEL